MLVTTTPRRLKAMFQMAKHTALPNTPRNSQEIRILGWVNRGVRLGRPSVSSTRGREVRKAHRNTRRVTRKLSYRSVYFFTRMEYTAHIRAAARASRSPRGLRWKDRVPLSTTSTTPAMATTAPMYTSFPSFSPFRENSWARITVRIGDMDTRMLTLAAEVWAEAVFCRKK